MLKYEVVEFPDGGVARVNVYHQEQRIRLQGMDIYWIHGYKCGMYVQDDGYEGKKSAAWEATDSGFHYIGGLIVLNPDHLWEGSWAPDEIAKEYGLL